MKVFITGGTGYIGRPTIKALIRDGHEVTALARSDNGAQLVAGLGATPVRGDLTDIEVLRAAAKGADAVIHLAQAGGGDIPEIDRAAAAAMQESPAVYVHTGGTWVYGDTGQTIDETGPLNPPGIVAWRLDNEREVLDRGGIVVLPGLVYGRNAGLIPMFYAESVYIGDGENHWGLVHVDDIAELYVRALTGRPGERYIGVGAGQPTAREVGQALSGGQAVSISLDEARKRMGPIADAFVLDQQLTSDKARKELGWAPKHADPLAELSR